MFTAFGYLMLGGSVLLIRQIVVGRVDETPTDLKDLFTALLNGDVDTARDVTGRRGENVGAVDSAVSIAPTLSTGSGSALLDEVRELGSKASGYGWGATGPDKYDCSGIVWRAMKNMGIYTGPRFTTSTVHRIGVLKKVSNIRTGDILVWPPSATQNGIGHMGVAISGVRYYSARSTAKGIGESSISGDSSYFGSKPVVYRVTSSESV